MYEDKRTHQAAPLRAFFDEQISHLQTLFSDFGLTSQEREEATQQQHIVEAFVDAANVKLRAAEHYAERLRPPVCALYRHLLSIAEQIPPPVELSHKAFARDAIVNALFVNVSDIDRLICGNRMIGDYLKSHATLFYALMTAQKNERTVFGVGMQGDMLVREVSQRAVNFSGHKLHRPCATDMELAQALKHYLFDEVITLIKAAMTQQVMEEAMKPVNGCYEARLKSLANPSVYLDTLLGYLQPVETLLKIECFHFKLSKLGIKLEQEEGQCVNEFEIYELTWRGERRDVLLRVVYPYQGVEV